MNLFNIEAGPWGGFVLIVFAVLAIGALWFATWIVSGLLFIVLIIVPATLLIYFGGRRLSRRMVHGRA